jgi:hypothetical protein
MAVSFLLTSCIEQRLYYLNPYPNLQNSYTATPVLRDSLPVANYLSGGFTIAAANHRGIDEVYIGQLKWHQVRQIGQNFQVFYGFQGSAGSYKVDWPYSSYEFQPYVDPDFMISSMGNKFTGAAGFTGGLSLIIPMGPRVEWRVLGIEGSVSREFGEYGSFRKNIPDSIVTMVDKKIWPASLGGFTELNFKLRNKKSMGMQFGLGSGLSRVYSHTEYLNKINTAYFNAGYHFTYDRYTGYVQLRAGTYFTGGQIGFSCRLE